MFRCPSDCASSCRGGATRDRKAAHWKPEWAKLYKDENRGADYLLIRVKPSRLEVVSMKRGINNDAVNWRPVSVELP